MKLKRTSVKVLLSASIILSMIPFSFNNLYASSMPYQHNGYFYTFTTTGGNKCVIDWYWWSEAPSSTASGSYIKFRVNTLFAITSATSTSYEYGLIEQDGGVTEQIVDWYSSGNVYSPEFKIGVSNCSYFHFRIIVATPSFWTNTTMANPNAYLNITTDQGTQTVSMSAQGNTSYWLKQIYNDVHSILTNGSGGGSIDMTSILQFLSDMSDNQITMIDNQETVIDKLDTIIEALQTQQGSAEEDSIDDNTQVNEDLQTESSTYEQLESQFNDDFNDNLENVPTQTLEDHLQTWSTGVTWFRTQMDNIYNNIGEFKYIASIAIVLAIALIFIGR